MRVEKNRTKIDLSVVRRQNQTQDDRNMSKKFIPENNIGRWSSQISEIGNGMTKYVMFLKSDDVLQHTWTGMYL